MSNSTKNYVKKLTDDQIESIEKLRKRIAGIQNIKNINTDDEYLLRFLYSTDFDVTLAFARMKEYHQNMLNYPEWYTKDSPNKRKELINTNFSVMIPSACDRDGRRIYVLKLGYVDVRNVSILDEAAVDDIWYEYILDKHPELSGKGICLIIDCEGISLKNIRWFNFQHVKMIFKKLASMPFKEFKVHLVNNSKMAKYLYKLLTPFIPEESKKRLYFHSTNWEELYKHIDKDFLLPEHGGYNKLNYPKIFEKLYEKDDLIANNFLLYRSVTNS